MAFAVHDCGFFARLAIEDTGSNENRLDKIVRIIKESKYSIHDISKVDLTPESPLPRFNMPFECGLALGSIRYGKQAGRDFLLMSGEPFQDKKTLSDLAGQDSKTHRNEPERAVASIRSFLSAKKQGEKTRGPDKIWERYQQFRKDLPQIAQELELGADEVLRFDFLNDYLNMAADWIAEPHSNAAKPPRGSKTPKSSANRR